ncbi:MAG: hypothetical protein BM557_09315 [Flavobacterium sp. MedPE-SWcel]|uniref:heavy-metal-associated domain-containing protein n=1 Tax=uncultured Flavobacterium sp. TaxID=165435 RepID=UPI00091586AB|nr:heavy-metal-associated domain-containing protein [uncultured Flavobacterium sp.]OIQ16935.1 MAG: hypothetical protein BM557_09315 [Flavobacterium sp. MedPE-SWcel]
MNKELKFKTSMNCGNCVAKVTPSLNEVVGADKWTVDTDNPDKILTVATEKVTEEEIMNAVKKVGFTIVPA